MVLRVPQEMGNTAMDILYDQGEEEAEKYLQTQGCLPRGLRLVSFTCDVLKDGKTLGDWSVVVGDNE